MKQTMCAFLLCTCLVGSGCASRDSAEKPSAASQTADPDVVILQPGSPKLDQIRTQTVGEARVPTDEVTSPGQLEVNPNRVSRVVLPLAGRIAAVSIKLGDRVEAGQSLLSIESPDADAAESAYLQAEAVVGQAKAGLLKAQADYDRAKDLFDHDAVAKKDVLNAENALAQAKAGVEQARATREQTLRRIRLLGMQPGDFGQKVTVRAPISGKVLEMSAVPGEYRNDINSPLITIADLATLWVSADVPESYIRLIQPGEHVDISLLAYPGEIIPGKVMRIADTVDPQTRTVKVHAELANTQGRFRPEMFARVRHIESTRVLPVVPAAAVVQGDGRSVVYVEEGRGRFRQTPVQVGRRVADLIPVESGIKPGDHVVVDGAMLLKSQ